MSIISNNFYFITNGLHDCAYLILLQNQKMLRIDNQIFYYPRTLKTIFYQTLNRYIASAFKANKLKIEIP